MPAPQPDPELPDSVVLSQFHGLRNTVAPERLTAQELERALNIDIDDAGQVRRRRGYTLKVSGNWHSVKTVAGTVYGVKDGVLGIIRPDYSFVSLYGAGSDLVSYVEVNRDIYFSSASVSGVINEEAEVTAWGTTNGQGEWLSPVYTPTETLGEVGGTLLGDPPKATYIEAYKGRIYLAAGTVLWATELYRYHFVDRTKNFMQFEDPITMIMAMTDGLYVGTTAGLYFLAGTLGAFKLNQITNNGVLPGSGVYAPLDLVHPQAQSQAVPTGIAAIMMTTDGVVAGFDGGNVYDLTHGRVIFPDGLNAAGLFRQDAGVTSYVAAMDSAGGPSANTRIGDHVDAEIIRAVDR